MLILGVRNAACWSLADIKSFTGSARQINPALRFLPVVYLQSLGAIAPNGWTFGAPYGGILDQGSAVTLVASFVVPEFSLAEDRNGEGRATTAQLSLRFLMHSPFTVDSSKPLCRRGGLWWNTTFVQVAVNAVVLQEHDLCTPLALDRAGLKGLPQFFSADILSHVVPGANAVAVKIFGRHTLRGMNHQSMHLWDLDVDYRQQGKARLLPVKVSFFNTSTAASKGKLFGYSNALTTPLEYADGAFACWQESDPRWPLAQERQLYKALVRSMRRALGPQKLLLTCHFGTTAWSLGGAEIQPANELDMLLTDGPLADGVMIWWQQLGLASDLAKQRGIFAPTRDPSFLLETAYSTAKGADLPLGWFARYHCTQQIPRGPLTVWVMEQQGGADRHHAPSLGRNFFVK